LFQLNVAKVDLNVGWSGEEERAGAGAMALSSVSWWQRSTRGRAGVRGPGVGPHRAAPYQRPARAIVIAWEPQRGDVGATSELSYYVGATDTRGRDGARQVCQTGVASDRGPRTRRLGASLTVYFSMAIDLCKSVLFRPNLKYTY
jgi:hypothetical protein